MKDDRVDGGCGREFHRGEKEERLERELLCEGV